ncbi:hypothetical protein [Desulfurispora thermophila]|nr:hypothetical protein [Desulfurispora thermophila]
MAKKNGKATPTGTEVRTGRSTTTGMACCEAKPEKGDTTTTMDGGC